MFRKGDHVILDPALPNGHQFKGIAYLVTKVNPTNVRLERLDGQSGIVDIHAAVLLPAPADMVAAALSTAQTAARFYLGQAVTVAGPGWRRPAGELYVVTGSRVTGYQIARLGGDSFTYFKGIMPGWLTLAEAPAFTPCAEERPLLFCDGQVVTVSAQAVRGWTRPAGELFAVIGLQQTRNAYSLAPLGGNGTDRFWQKVPHDALALMTFAA